MKGTNGELLGGSVSCDTRAAAYVRRAKGGQGWRIKALIREPCRPISATAQLSGSTTDRIRRDVPPVPPIHGLSLTAGMPQPQRTQSILRVGAALVGWSGPMGVKWTARLKVDFEMDEGISANRPRLV